MFFSPLRGSFPDHVHALYIGGGYLESHAAALAANRPMVEGVRVFAEAGGVVYAECGGLMYLSQSIQTRDGRQHEVTLNPKPQALYPKAPREAARGAATAPPNAT